MRYILVLYKYNIIKERKHQMKHDKLTKELFEKWNKIQNKKDIPLKRIIQEASFEDIKQDDMSSPAIQQYAKPIHGAVLVQQDLGDTLVVGLSGTKQDYEEYAELPNAVLYKGKKYYKASFDSDKHYVVYKLGDHFAVPVSESKKSLKIKENNESIKQEAIQYLITTYDFNPTMNPLKALREFEVDNDVKFTKEERQEILQMFRNEWKKHQKLAGAKPLTPSERMKAFRDLESDDEKSI